VRQLSKKIVELNWHIDCLVYMQFCSIQHCLMERFFEEVAHIHEDFESHDEDLHDFSNRQKQVYP
jgi:hypothetical protein